MAVPDLGPNLPAMFERRVRRGGDRPLLWSKREGSWHPLSCAQVADEVGRLANALQAAGLAPGDRVLLVAENGPRWCIADLAIMTAGGISVPTYTTYTTEDYAFLLEHAGAKLVITAGAGIARRLLPAVRDSAVAAVFLLDGERPAGLDLPLHTYAEALAGGADAPPARTGLESRPDDTACFIYTSGTSGRPKGVMLTHRNIMANIEGAWDLLQRFLPDERIFLSFLPLSHAYEHTVGQFMPIAIDGEIYYAESVEQLAGNLQEVRPNILPCVPRLFEVFRQRTIQAIERRGGMSARLFRQAVALGTLRYHRGGSLPLHLRPLDLLLDRLVRRKVQARFGGRLAAMVAGGGALNPEVGIFFAALGVPVCHGYGQTEASPVISVTPPGSCHLDTVGPPLEGVEVEIAQDGEILVRGDLVMKGYWKDPEGTGQAIREGWLHTGDIGELDALGNLRITDRKKDILVLSGGDNVAPQRIETQAALEPAIGQIIVYGDRRPYVVALIVPSQEVLKAAAAEAGLATDDPDLVDAPELKRRIDAAMREVNARLGPVERVRRWRLHPEPFSVENHFMTPTLKLRRARIYKEFAGALEALYTREKERAA